MVHFRRTSEAPGFPGPVRDFRPCGFIAGNLWSTLRVGAHWLTAPARC